MGVALMVGCSGTPAGNRSYGPGRQVYSFNTSSEGSVYVFSYKGQEYMVASNGYKGGISLIQINNSNK